MSRPDNYMRVAYRSMVDLWRTDDDYNVWGTTQSFYEELGTTANRFTLSAALEILDRLEGEL